MTKNEFLPFGTAANANVLPNADYQALPARSAGFSSGVAKSEELNTVWRQGSTMAAVLGQFIADKTGQDVLDDGDVSGLLDKLKVAMGGCLIGIQRFTTSGTYTPTPGTRYVIVEAVGGGGGGGGVAGTTSSTSDAGGGGGAGALSVGRFPVDFSNVVVTVGNGGATSSSGGASSFGSLISASGGAGAPVSTVDNNPMFSSPGRGGETTTGGNVYSKLGDVGSAGIAFNSVTAISGTGASSKMGAGGRPVGISVAAKFNGVDGSGFGAGGSGGTSGGGSGSAAGGSGSPGLVLVYEYS
ncbi:TPA: hypothetical protein ACX137_002874 [Serratia marcescens]